MSNFGSVSGYLHTDGRWMVNGQNERIILRGWAAGNWMDPEGFMSVGIPGMYAFPDPDTFKNGKLVNNIRFDRQRTMAYGVRELAGTQYANTFWQRWYRTHLTEADIRTMAEMGYNSVRLPLDGNAFLYEEPGIEWNEDTFAMLDDVLDWCEKWGLYAILDLHAAPGGQSGLGCDNGIDNMPHTFTEPESRERTILIWEKFASRYKDRWIVGAYELLNEPISPLSTHYLSQDLRCFYDETIARIRRIDQKHMFILEPPEFSRDMTFLDKGFDPEYSNWAYSVHMYWFTPEMRDFYRYLEPSRRLNVPVWIGEGRGTPAAMAVFYDMLAEYGVGFNLFCWKAMRDVNGVHAHSILHYAVPDGWEAIRKYVEEGGPRPSYVQAQELLDRWIEASRFENCTIDPEMAPYSVRRQGITIPAAGYDGIGGDGISFHGTWREGNIYSYRTEDRIKMVAKPNAPVSGMFGHPVSGLDNLLVELSDDEYVCYSVNYVVSEKKPVLIGNAMTDTVCRVSVGSRTTELAFKAGAVSEQLLSLENGPRSTVKIQVITGKLQIEKISFPV